MHTYPICIESHTNHGFPYCNHRPTRVRVNMHPALAPRSEGVAYCPECLRIAELCERSAARAAALHHHAFHNRGPACSSNDV